MDDDYLEDAADDEALVDIVDEGPSTSQSVMSSSLPGVILSDETTPTPAIRIIQGKKKIRLSQSAVTAIKRKLSVNGRKGILKMESDW